MPNRKSKRNNPNKNKKPKMNTKKMSESTAKEVVDSTNFFYCGESISVCGRAGAKLLKECQEHDWSDWKEGVSDEAYIQQLQMTKQMMDAKIPDELFPYRMKILYCLNIYYCVYIAKCLPNNNDNGIVIVSDNGNEELDIVYL